MRLTDIRGQDAAVGTLRRALAGEKVAHAYLFSGVPGVGKKLAALALARALNCTHGAEDACGDCLSCRKVSKGIHPDVTVLSVPEGKKLIPIESIRQLERKLAVPPYEGRANVAIIDPADMMSDQAANALLKTLEEPRRGSFLILISVRSSGLLPTVRSRCQSVRFRPLPVEIAADILEKSGVDAGQAALAAALGSGSLEQAGMYLRDDLQENIDAVFGLIRGATETTPLEGLAIAQTLRSDRSKALATLDLLMLVLKEILWLTNRPGESVQDSILVRRFGEPLLAAAQRLTAGRAAAFIAAASDVFDNVKYLSANPQLAVEGMVMTVRTQNPAERAVT